MWLFDLAFFSMEFKSFGFFMGCVSVSFFVERHVMLIGAAPLWRPLHVVLWRGRGLDPNR